MLLKESTHVTKKRRSIAAKSCSSFRGASQYRGTFPVDCCELFDWRIEELHKQLLARCRDAAAGSAVIS